MNFFSVTVFFHKTCIIRALSVKSSPVKAISSETFFFLNYTNKYKIAFLQLCNLLHYLMHRLTSFRYLYAFNVFLLTQAFLTCRCVSLLHS